jgi:hypothetical protein
MKSTWRVWIAAASLSWLLAPLWAIAAPNPPDNPLDAPLVPERPTLRTELRRGSDAASKCTTDHTFKVAATARRIDDVQADNRQKMGQGYDAFDIGLYFSAWTGAQILVSSSSGSHALANLEEAQRAEQIYWTAYVFTRKKVNLMDDTVIEALFPVSTTEIKKMVAAAVSHYGD